MVICGGLELGIYRKENLKNIMIEIYKYSSDSKSYLAIASSDNKSSVFNCSDILNLATELEVMQRKYSMSALAKIKVFRERLFLAGPWKNPSLYIKCSML